MKKLLSITIALMLTATPVNAGNEEYIAHLESAAVEAMAKVWDIEKGELTEDATKELLEEAKGEMEYLPPKNEHRKNLEVIAQAAEEALKHKGMRLYGVCVITHYCNGACCCGQWAGCNTASGVPPTPNHTVAHNYLPFGTRVLIDGQEYVVEDRGGTAMDGGDWFDIYIPDHTDATKRGMRRTDVYVIGE